MAIQIPVVLTPDIKKAVKGIGKFTKTAVSGIRKVEDAVFSLQGAIAAVGVGVALNEIAQAISTVTEAASIQEDAVNSMNTALAISGEFSEEASRQMQAFASSIEDTTRFGDEAILQQIALAKSFGATNEQAQLVTKAAVELAEAQNKSLDEATRQVSKSLGGLAGELGETNPAIKALTAEQLKAGDAARILIEQYGGTAASKINTFSGAVEQTSNAFGGLLESVGEVITKNPVVIETIKQLGGIFKGAIGFIKDNQQAIADFVGDGIKRFVKQIPNAIKSLKVFARAILGLKLGFDTAKIAFAEFVNFLLDIEVINTIVKNFVEGFKLIGVVITKVWSIALTGLEKFLGLAAKIPGVGKLLEGLRDGVSGFRQAIDDINVDLAESIGTDLIDTEGIKKNLDDIKQESLNSSAEFEKTIQKFGEGIDNVAERAEQAVGRIVAAPTTLGGGGQQPKNQRKNVIDAAKEAGEALLGSESPITDAIKAFDGITFDKAVGDLLGAGKGLIDDVSSIGLKDIGDSIFAGLRDGAIFLGEVLTLENLAAGFGAIFGGELLTTLQAGLGGIFGAPKKLSDATQAFRDSIGQMLTGLFAFNKEFPKQIVNLINTVVVSFPVLVQEFVKAVPKIVDGLVAALPVIAQALGEAAPIITKAIVEALPPLIRALPQILGPLIKAIPLIAEEILKGLPEIILALSEAAPQIIRQLVDAVPAVVEALADNIGPIAEALVIGIVAGSGEIVAALVDSLLLEGGLERIVGALLRAIPRIALGLAEGFIGAIERLAGPAMAIAFSDGFKQASGALAQGWKDILAAGEPFDDDAKNLIQDIKDAGTNLKNAMKEAGKPFRDLAAALNAFEVPSFGGGGGGGGGVLEKVGLAATGGRIPAGFPNDTFPVLTTSGEEILDPGVSSDLRAFLADGGGNSRKTEELLIQLVNQIRSMESRVEIAFDNEFLADAMLELDRTNARRAVS